MMKTRYILSLVFFCISVSVLNAQVRSTRLDTAIKVGKQGYRVRCTNKSPELNMVTVSPSGFEKEVREFSFEIKGRLVRAEVDDLNRDGYSDLVMYVYTNDSIPKGSVVGIMAVKTESIAPIVFPDTYDDPKLRVGYKGKDEFFLMEGTLIRQFPVYPVEGAPAAAQSGNLVRYVRYSVIPEERGGFRFKVISSRDFVKQ